VGVSGQCLESEKSSVNVSLMLHWLLFSLILESLIKVPFKNVLHQRTTNHPVIRVLVRNCSSEMLAIPVVPEMRKQR
jgi:hypothetical protein